MDSYRIPLDQTLYYLRVRPFYSPNQNAPVLVVAHHTIFNEQSAQLANYPNCLLVLVAFDLRIDEMQVTVLLNPDCWDGGVAGFD